jgi:NADH-quinone oxidoreductase subunit N
VAVICLIGSVLILGSYRGFTNAPHGGGLAALSAIVVAAAATVASTADILVLLLGLETMALCAYALVWSGRTAASNEAAIKYYVQGAVATGLFVLGLAIVFGLYGGSTSYVWIRGVMGAEAGPPVTTAFALLAFALAYKLGAFPFHSWALDAFESAPPWAASLLAGVPKLAAIVALMVLFTRSVFAGVPADYLVWVFSALAIASMAFGALGGLAQRSYTRMLAYSGIAQIGYALVAVVTGAGGMMPAALLVSAYAVAGSVALLAPAAFRAVRPGWDGTIRGLAGLGRERALLGVALSVALFSLVGMPLTAGFWGKFLVFGAAVSAGYWWLALIGVLASVVSFGYYGSVLKALYFEESTAFRGDVDGEVSPAGMAPDYMAEATVVIAGLALLGVGSLPLVFGLAPVLQFLTFS